MHNSQYWIEKLSLEPHPEGGYFKEMYRSDDQIPSSALPARYQGDRCFGTSIYFLLEGDNFSAFHRIQSDEGWHFYAGNPVRIYTLTSNGIRIDIDMGSDPDKGQHLQYVIPFGYWFAAEVVEPGGFSLVGCTVNPGFDFNDFELAKRSELINMFPQHEEIITRLTRIS